MIDYEKAFPYDESLIDIDESIIERLAILRLRPRILEDMPKLVRDSNPSLISDHYWRPDNHPRRPTELCLYMNCRQPVEAHAYSVKYDGSR